MKPKIVRVLLTEDNPGDARLIQQMLVEMGSPFQLARWAATLREAVEAINGGEIDFILLDLNLPDSRGMATFKAVFEPAQGIPIIVLSGLDDEQLAVQTVHEGAQDYLVKDQIDSHLLTRAMRYAIERIRAEAELAAERNLLRNVVDHLPDPIYVKDLQCRYILSNAAHRASVEIKDQSDLEGRTVFDFFPEPIAEKFHRDDLHVIESGQTLANIEEVSVDAAGKRRWLLTTKVPLRDEAGNISGMAGIGRDITVQKTAEEQMTQANASLFSVVTELKQAHDELRSVQLQLIEAEKMKSIGRLAAGVAHEVKNPLAIITMGIDYLTQQNLGEDRNVPIILKDIADAVARADAVIKGLLDFSAPKRLELAPSDLNAIISQALVLVRGEMGTKFQVVKELQPDLPPVPLDRAKISQVFVNVFINAIHAMKDGGTLKVRTFARQLTGVGENIGDRRSENFRVGDTIVVAEVEDTGTGIPEDQLTKIYDPFFTTKPTGYGTGLGLTVTKTIIDLHGATIDMANRPDCGAKVVLMFRG